MAKLNRERALQQRRLEKQARKDARRQAAASADEIAPVDDELGPDDEARVVAGELGDRA